MQLRTITVSAVMMMAATVSANANGGTKVMMSEKSIAVQAPDTLKTEERRKKKVRDAFGQEVTDTLAEGGLDYNPFDKAFMAKRLNPYTYSIEEEKKKHEIDESDIEQVLLRKSQNKWFHKIYLAAYGGVNKIAPLNTFTYDASTIYGGMLGYQFNPLHALRLTAAFGHYTTDKLPESIWNVNLGLDYTFNLTNYMYGVTAKRWFDFSPVIGVGVSYARNSVWNHTCPRLRGALNIDRRLSGNSHIFVEPYISVVNDGFDYHGPNNPRQYDLEWGVLAGIRLDMKPDTTKQRLFMPDFNPNLFVEFTVGPNFYWIRHHFKQTMTKTIGSNYQLMFGKWFDPLLGARVGLVANDCFWKHETREAVTYGNTTISEKSTRFYRGGSTGGRIELMLRPMNFFSKWREMTRKFELDITGGFELGSYNKINVRNYGEVRKLYIGYTYAIDLLYKIAPNTWLMLEPRAVIYNYTIADTKWGTEGNWRDKQGSINFGLRIQRPTKEDRDNFFRGEFEPNWEVGVIGGTNKYISRNRTITKEKLNWLVGINTAYNFTPLHSVMLEVEYDRYYQQMENSYEVASGTNMMRYTGMMTRTYNVGYVKAGYRLNLTNLLMGKDYDRRRFDLYGYAGPMFGRHFKTTYELNRSENALLGGTGEPIINGEDFGGRSAFGIFGGFNSSYHVAEHLAINIRPEVYSMFKGNFMSNGNQNTVFLNVDLGLTYTF